MNFLYELLMSLRTGDETLCLMLDILYQKLGLLCERHDKEDDFSEGEGECGYTFSSFSITLALLTMAQ